MISLQVFSQLQSVLCEASVSLHLVEVSPALSRLQAQTLTGDSSREADAEDELVYRRGETAAGLPVSWYRRLEDVPTGRSQTCWRVCTSQRFCVFGYNIFTTPGKVFGSHIIDIVGHQRHVFSLLTEIV